MEQKSTLTLHADYYAQLNLYTIFYYLFLNHLVKMCG